MSNIKHVLFDIFAFLEIEDDIPPEQCIDNGGTTDAKIFRR